ncbi:efflux transporter outer membrane subunit [Burkholderia perseverans]|uniref:efflux transporter outer membrane subunit n=1 Tax=Burkholderia perseverans TaxID=2615214 RepID=UPI001FEE4D6C|nr:efflux transporter outer membrane subunit [Burkholderia perseverans]
MRDPFVSSSASAPSRAMPRRPRPATVAGAAGLLFAAALLAGCSVGEPYRPPAPDAARGAPFDAAGDARVTAGGELPDQWWRLYDDPALDALVSDALAGNRDLAVAAARVQRARAVLDEAGAARLPDTKAGFGVDYGKHNADQIEAAADGTSAPTRWGFAPSFAFSWEVDLWGRVRYLVDAARADAQAVQAASDAMRVEVASETTAAYVRACAYGERIDVAERSIDIADRLAALTGKQRAHGLVSDLEVARSRAFADDTRTALPALAGARRAALYELAVLTGRPPGEIPAAAAACHATPVLARPFPVGDGAALLRRRPDVRESERRLAAANARIGVATADLYPSIQLGGSVNWLSTTGDPSTLGNKYAIAWGVGPLITWHFPNLAADRAQLAQAHADDAAARASFDAQVLRALKETEQALTLYGAAWRQHSAIETARGEHARAYRLAEANYKAGALDFLGVLDAQRSLVAADSALAVSTQQVALDQVAVFKALGGGWQQ